MVMCVSVHVHNKMVVPCTAVEQPTVYPNNEETLTQLLHGVCQSGRLV